jgi:hypothetical protein
MFYNYKKLKMKNLFLLFLLFVVPNEVFAQVCTGFYHFKGKIKNKYSISLDLNFNSNDISGTMYYDKIGKYIKIKGKCYKKDSVFMQGYINDTTVSDVFRGKFYSHKIRGLWYNAKKTVKYNFFLQNTDENCVLVHNFSFDTDDSVKYGNDYAHFTYKVDLNYPAAFPFAQKDKKIIEEIYGIKEISELHKKIRDTINLLEHNWKADLYENLQDSLPVFAASYDYSDESSIIFNQNCLFSYEENYYQYTGGAHGLTGIFFCNFDLKTGKELAFYDIFTCDSNMFLHKFIVPNLKKYTLENCEDSLKNLMIWDSVPFPDYWYISDTSINFFYNEYSVLPYVCGTQDIAISYKKLKPYLKKWFIKRLDL